MPSEALPSPRTASLLTWRAGDRKTYLLALMLVVGMAVGIGLSIAAQFAGPVYGDYFAMWSFARFALTHPPPQIYDPDALHAFQLGLKPNMEGRFPFPYPPSYLLPLLPIALVPIFIGWVLWSLCGLAAYLVAVLARGGGHVEFVFVTLAPATVMSLVTGQNGMFSAALMVGGVRLMTARPYLAGVLFGLMSFKPQLGLLVPVALVATRNWRCFGAAAVTSVLFALAAAAAFGASIWAVWIAALRTHWSDYVVTGNLTRPRMPTITGNLQLMGVPASIAQGTQLVAAIVAAVLVWMCLRRRGADGIAIAALLVGSFLATPYSLFYDLPPVTFAMLLLIRHTLGAGGALGLGEVLIVLFAFVMPYGQFLVGVFPLPITATALVLLFGVIVRRALASPSKLAFATAVA